MEVTSGSTPELANPGRHGMHSASGDPVEAKCVKRRRRKSSAVALSSSDQQGDHQLPVPQRTPIATNVKRSSRFRGVSRHRWTGRYEAHLWDKGSWNPTKRKKGKQVYLGAYDEEESAARAYDLAALKFWGTSTFTNFPVTDYEKEIENMQTITKEEHLASLRRRSSGSSGSVSKYRGVARHQHNGRWEARIGGVFGNKYLYLGTNRTQEEAAQAYDTAAIEYKGINALTNFELNTYFRRLKSVGINFNFHLPSQESKPILGPLPPMETYPNQISIERSTKLLFLHPNPLISIKDDLASHRTQGNSFSGKSPISSCIKSSSSTALGLLLKSSLFKELVEKNLNTIEEENEENETKTISMIGNNKEEGEFSINKDIYFPCMDICTSSRVALPTFHSKEDSSLPLWYNKQFGCQNEAAL